MLIHSNPLFLLQGHLLALDLKSLPKITQKSFHLHVQSRRINIALIWRILKFTADIMPTTLIDQINWVAFDSFLALNLIWLKSILFRS
jgi:hypothetical protein